MSACSYCKRPIDPKDCMITLPRGTTRHAKCHMKSITSLKEFTIYWIKYKIEDKDGIARNIELVKKIDEDIDETRRKILLHSS